MDMFWDIVNLIGNNLYFVLFIAVLIFTMIIQARLNSTYNKYSKIANSRGMTGAQAAEEILRAHGVYDVEVKMIQGKLSDNFNPRTKVLSLSPEVYSGCTIAAVGIAAHEAGHAIQHDKSYLPVKLRTALVPVANIGSKFSFIIILVGVLISSFAQSNIGYYLAIGGLCLFLFTLLFGIVTLPVEFNASKRAKTILSDTLAMDRADLKGVKKVLNSAAMTYVASVASSVLYLFRMLAIVGSARRN